LEHSLPPARNDLAYAHWSGRLSAVLDLLLQEPLDEHRATMARQALSDYDNWNKRTRDPLVSPSGDHRERAVPCAVCGALTWNIAALCDDHLEVVEPELAS
jgi:hypothetical protein